MPWKLRNVGTATDYNIVDASRSTVSCDLRKLNEAKVIVAMAVPIDVGVEVKVRDDVVDPVTKAVTEQHELLHGKVTKYTQISKGVTTNTYEYQIRELAVDLEKYRINDGVNYTVNCPSQSVSLYAASVLTGSTWAATTGCPGTNVLEALQFRYMTALAGLNKVITELGAATANIPYYIWFYPADKKVGWGTSRNDRTSVNFTKGLYYNYEEFKTIRQQASGVVIYGANSSSHGMYPATPAAHDLQVFQYDTATTDAECTALAFRVYTDWCKDPKRRIQFVLRPPDTKVGGSYILEGDTIQVDGSNWVIMDMTYSPGEVLVGVNAGEDSVLYQLGDKLKPIAGSASGATEFSWTPGVQNVSSDGTTKSKFVMDISSPTDISDSTVMLNVEIGPYKVYGYPATTGVSNNKLSEVTVPSTVKVYDGYQLAKPMREVYLPVVNGNAYIKSADFASGFQYAIATLNFTIWDDNGLDNDNVAILQIVCQYSYDGVTWYDGSYQQEFRVGPLSSTENSHTAIPVTNVYSVPGTNNSGAVYVRWRVYNNQQDWGDNHGYDLAWISGMIDVFPRHAHDINQSGQSLNTILPNQTEDMKETTIPPPGSVACIVNGASHTASNNVPFDIKDHLIAGKNTIEFTSSGTPCTVLPSTHFMMFG